MRNAAESTGGVGNKIRQLFRLGRRQIDSRPFGWSVEVSDWPVGKARDDLTPGQAIEALRGLEKHYQTAMRTLASARDPDDDIAAQQALG